MARAKVHNYAFRKALAYVRNKKGKLESESIRLSFENVVHQKISTKSPYLPTYHPIKSFVILLQVIKNRLGEEKAIIEGRKTNRCYDVGLYLYTGAEEKDSPYHYLDPHKHLPEVITEFYNTLSIPSSIFKDCDATLTEKGSKIKATWGNCEGYIEFFHYLEGVHAGMIKASTTNGFLSAKIEDDVFVFEIELVD